MPEIYLMLQWFKPCLHEYVMQQKCNIWIADLSPVYTESTENGRILSLKRF